MKLLNLHLTEATARTIGSMIPKPKLLREDAARAALEYLEELDAATHRAEIESDSDEDIRPH